MLLCHNHIWFRSFGSVPQICRFGFKRNQIFKFRISCLRTLPFARRSSLTTKTSVFTRTGFVWNTSFRSTVLSHTRRPFWRAILNPTEQRVSGIPIRHNILKPAEELRLLTDLLTSSKHPEAPVVCFDLTRVVFTFLDSQNVSGHFLPAQQNRISNLNIWSLLPPKRQTSLCFLVRSQMTGTVCELRVVYCLTVS